MDHFGEIHLWRRRMSYSLKWYLRSVFTIGALAVGLMATGVTGTAAQDAKWQEVVSKAKAEARVNLYSAAVPQQIERLIAAFHGKYPEIKVVHTRGVSELPPRIAAEREAGNDGADAFIF